MVTKNLEDEIVILYDRLHELYVNSIRFYDVCSINECTAHIKALYKVLDSVNECMMSIAFGGMGTVNFLDEVNLNELYMKVLLNASEIQNAIIVGPDSNDLIELQSKIHNNTNAIHAAIQDIMQIFIEVLNN